MSPRHSQEGRQRFKAKKEIDIWVEILHLQREAKEAINKEIWRSDIKPYKDRIKLLLNRTTKEIDNITKNVRNYYQAMINEDLD